MLTRRRTLALTLCALSLGGCESSPRSNLTTTAKPQQVVIDTKTADKLCDSASADSDYSGPAYQDIWTRMRAGYQLGEINNPRVEKHLQYYLKHPSYMARVTERGSLYLYHIVSELDKRGMPLELALLPIVESAFDPFAYSHGRASGMWQFIPGTGLHYGLKQNWWYDGRRDVLASTEAAVNFLSDLHRQMDGDWLLALAAYNSGGGNVRKAIRKNKEKGKPTDFWSLNLPRETREYVPQLIALSKIIMHADDYKVSLTPVKNEPYFAAVDIGSQIDLAQAASMADIPLGDLYKLNAGFNRWATDPDGPHRLLVPTENADIFRQQLAQLPASSRVGWERYKVRSGDSLLAISKRFNTTVDVLREHNNIRGNLIRQGQMMLIPKATLPANQYAQTQTQRVKRIQANSRGNNGSRKLDYTVRSGDSLWSIAREHDVSVRQLAKWNAMAPKDTLRANQKLVIWSDNPSTSKKDGIIRKVAYKVRSGDSLARIAGKFNLSVNDIVRWNSVSKSGYIHPGQSLTLFVDVTRTN